MITVVEHWLKREIAQWVHPMKDRSDDPSHHERVLTAKINLKPDANPFDRAVIGSQSLRHTSNK